LDEPVTNRGQVNVYLDEEIVPSDATNGWTFKNDRQIEFHGTSCESWTTEPSNAIYVISGCDTVTAT
jgi:hypothetical protein